MADVPRREQLPERFARHLREHKASQVQANNLVTGGGGALLLSASNNDLPSGGTSQILTGFAPQTTSAPALGASLPALNDTGFWNPDDPEKITAPVDGLYLATAKAYFLNAHLVDSFEFKLSIELVDPDAIFSPGLGHTVGDFNGHNHGGAGHTTPAVHEPTTMTAGQYIQAVMDQTFASFRRVSIARLGLIQLRTL
jgi:hypothetical protein